MTTPRTETQAALDHFVGKVVKARYSAPGRDPEAVLQEIAQDFAILIADANDAKADENTVPSTREVEHISNNIHDTISEAFIDTNEKMEALHSFIDPNENHHFGHMEYFGRRH